MSTWRRSVPAGLLLAGLIASTLVFATGDPTWKAVWIGLAATCLTAGLVDGSALLDAHRRERPILRVVGHRVGFIHQRYLWITKAVFALEWNDATDVPSQLRALGDSHVVDLRTAMPQMIPPTTRLDYALRCRAEISDALAVALSLAASTGDAHRLEALDQVLRANALDSWLGAATVAPLGAVAAGGVLAQTAADILEAIQRQFRHFSKEAGGDWMFGQLRAE